MIEEIENKEKERDARVTSGPDPGLVQSFLDESGVRLLWSKIKGLFNKTVKSITVTGNKIIYTRGDNSAGNATIPDFGGATSGTSGTSGFVPAPSAGKQGAFLRADGTWAVPIDTDTTYGVATQSTNGLMSSNDKAKLDGIANNANAYSLPEASSTVRGGVKTGYSQNGKNYPVQLDNERMYVSVPWVDTDTTYGVVTQSVNGLMSAVDKKKLDGIDNNANDYSLPAATSSVRGGVKIGYSQNGRNYPVQLSSEKMFVNVPWTDTNTQTITGVKGNAESAYRTGNVNMTPANIGAVNKAGDTITGALTILGALNLSNKITQFSGNPPYILGLDNSNVVHWQYSGQTSVGSATKAIQDSDGNQINATYQKKMDLSALENFEIVSGSSNVSILHQKCFKIGNRVCISFYCSVSSSVANVNTPFATIPSGYSPKADIPSVHGMVFIQSIAACYAGYIRIFSNSSYSHRLIGQTASSNISSTTVSFVFEYYI